MKLELTKKVNIKKWQVVASYKIKVENPAFVGILKYALEQEQNEAVINSETLHKYLLNPLSINACSNILHRLKEERYFYQDKDTKYYRLTRLGQESAEMETFYTSKNGVLDIYYCDLKILNQPIILIKELERPENLSEKEENLSKYAPRELKEQIDQTLHFDQQQDIILERFDSKVLPSKDEETLKIESNEQKNKFIIIRLETRF